MTFGEKVKEARLAMNLSQTELSQLTGISERSLYTYEQLGTLPRKSNIKKLAEALHISVSYLLDDEETGSQSYIGEDMFLAEAREQFGAKGAREAQEVLGYGFSRHKKDTPGYIPENEVDAIIYKALRSRQKEMKDEGKRAD